MLRRALCAKELQALLDDAKKYKQLTRDGEGEKLDATSSVHAWFMKTLWWRDREHNHFFEEDEDHPELLWDDASLDAAPRAEDVYPKGMLGPMGDYIQEDPDGLLNEEDFSTHSFWFAELLARATPMTASLKTLFEEVEASLDYLDDADEEDYGEALEDSRTLIENDLADAITHAIKKHHAKRLRAAAATPVPKAK